MSLPSLPDRGDVLAMLATYGDRAPQDVGEQLGSLEVTWLIAQAEQRYAVVLDLPDEAFATMQTVSGEVEALRAAVAGSLAAGGPGPESTGAAGTPAEGAGAGAGRAGSLAEGGNG